jgi:hypothetical protein
MNDREIELYRVAGDIVLVLRDGPDEDRQSLLRAIEQAAGREERERIEAWVNDGMPGA